MNLNSRQANFIGALACAGMMAYALFAQYVLELAPCPLCMFQRVAVITMGLMFFAAALQAPAHWGRWVYTVLIVAAGLGGAGVAGRQVWLQNLPADKVPACGPGLDYMLGAFPFAEVLEMVLSGSGECAEIQWSFLGLSMPAWVLISLLVLMLFAVWANRRPRPRAH